MSLYGFGNYHQTETEPDLLPKTQNSPQQCPQGLYAEQLSGTAFTRPREFNLHTWFYRLAPSVMPNEFTPYPLQMTLELPTKQSPNQQRWSPLPNPSQPKDFIDSWMHVAGNEVINAYRYFCNESMHDKYFRNHDGELLIVPYLGTLSLKTECGNLLIKPGMIAVIPRGIVFKVELIEGSAAGYIAENAGHPLVLPQLGPIGSNGLANPRHFMYPCAAYEKDVNKALLVSKYDQGWWQAECAHSPLNVLAWHGNYAPYSYDLSLFNTINTVSFDHPDPSIFTVLTSPSEVMGVANLDFVLFPPRWMVADHTFRPPYFHRNIMSELMGLVQGEYDAKKEGFLPGGISIHNCMAAHGPDKQTFEMASQETLKPLRYDNTLAFMFETRLPWRITQQAMEDPSRQKDYLSCWDGFV